MTEAGEKWVIENLRPCGTAVHIQIEQAEHFIRAFCGDVKMLAQTKQVERADTKLFLAFEELKRKLLEGK